MYTNTHLPELLKPLSVNSLYCITILIPEPELLALLQ